MTLTGVVSSLATTPGHTYTFRGKLYVDQSNSCTHLRVGADLSEAIRDSGGGASVLASGLSMKQAVTELEKRMILDALDRCQQNQQRAAKALGMSRQGFDQEDEALCAQAREPRPSRLNPRPGLSLRTQAGPYDRHNPAVFHKAKGVESRPGSPTPPSSTPSFCP